MCSPEPVLENGHPFALETFAIAHRYTASGQKTTVVDPYVEVRAGAEVFRTPCVHASPAPAWNWDFDLRLPAPLGTPGALDSVRCARLVRFRAIALAMAFHMLLAAACPRPSARPAPSTASGVAPHCLACSGGRSGSDHSVTAGRRCWSQKAQMRPRGTCCGARRAVSVRHCQPGQPHLTRQRKCQTSPGDGVFKAVHWSITV